MTNLRLHADECDALADALRGLFHAAADRELAEMDEHQFAGDDGYEPDWEAIHRQNQEYRGRDRAERDEQMGVEGW